MLAWRAARTAARSRGLALGSGRPERAAVVNSRMILVKTLPRLLSCAPFRYMMFLNCEWPDIFAYPASCAGRTPAIAISNLPLNANYQANMAGLGRIGGRDAIVGWAERREAHRIGARKVMGFAALSPSYAVLQGPGKMRHQAATDP